MNTYEIYALIAIIAIVGTGVVFKLFPSLRTKLFKDGEKVVKEMESAIPVIDKTIDTVEKVAPNCTPIQVLGAIKDYAKIAVGNSEQLFNNNKLTADQRFESAKAIVNSAMTELGIEVDENKENLIESSIQNFVRELPHADVDVKALKEELEKAKNDLMSEKSTTSQLEADKTAVLTQLKEIKKQKDDALAQLNAIKGAVKGIQDTTPVETTTQATPVAEQPTTPIQ